jgi:hypothetical protein
MNPAELGRAHRHPIGIADVAKHVDGAFERLDRLAAPSEAAEHDRPARMDVGHPTAHLSLPKREGVLQVLEGILVRGRSAGPIRREEQEPARLLEIGCGTRLRGR